MSKYKLLLFTSNKNKIAEIKKVIPKKKFKLYTLENFSKIKMPVENKSTFKKNAEIKSIYGYKKFKIPCLADDSGICINALNNKPGVNSNRYQKKLGGYNKAFDKILKNLEKTKNRKAYFQTIISFTYDKNKTVFFEGRVGGLIAKKPMGNKGFGYDPIFLPEKSQETFGQMSKLKKNKVSHRIKALKKFINFFKQFN